MAFLPRFIIINTPKTYHLSKKELAVRNVVTTKSEPNQYQLVTIAIEAMQELKAIDIVLLDLTEISEASTDYFVICHGTSSTHISGIADRVQKNILETLGEHPTRVEGRQGSHWQLIDYFSVIVHIFDREKRDFYDLEGLWSDAKITPIDNV